MNFMNILFLGKLIHVYKTKKHYPVLILEFDPLYNVWYARYITLWLIMRILLI